MLIRSLTSEYEGKNQFRLMSYGRLAVGVSLNPWEAHSKTPQEPKTSKETMPPRKVPGGGERGAGSKRRRFNGVRSPDFRSAGNPLPWVVPVEMAASRPPERVDGRDGRWQFASFPEYPFR
jgi:hypothetical protein